MIRNLKELGINLQTIIKRLEQNQDLMKLLFYTDKDPLSHPDLTQEQIKNSIYNKRIKIIPRIGDEDTAKSTIALRVLSGQKNPENDEFVSINIKIDIYVPMTQWVIKNQNLRPFAIMGAIQESLNGKTINGLGKIKGGNFDLGFLTDESSGYVLDFSIEEYV